MTPVRYVRFLTYGVCAACIGLLWRLDRQYTEADLVRVYPADHLIPKQAGSWRKEWFEGADAYRSARLSPRQVMDLAERELKITDWKAFQPRDPKIASVRIDSTQEGLVWGIYWIDASGFRYSISVYDSTGEVRHSPEVGKSVEKDRPFQDKEPAEPGATDNPGDAQ